MKKLDRSLFNETIENLGRIQELSEFVSFFFSKMYAIEKDFYRTSKYARISRHVVFLAIQKSKSRVLDILHKVGIYEQNRIAVDEQLKSSAIEIRDMVKTLEKDYYRENYEGMVKQLEIIGNKCIAAKDKLKVRCDK
jgi:hypothetical protein